MTSTPAEPCAQTPIGGALQFRQELFVVDGEVAILPLEGDELDATEPGIIKLTVTNNAIAVVEDALSLTSNHGLSRTNPLERHYRKAWEKAEAILMRAAALQDKTGYRKPADGHATAGARRLLALADQGTRIDKRLWTEIAKLTGANSNTTALVGTREQVAEVFGDYYDLGISHFLIRGFDPLIDTIEYGRELIPLTRKLIAGRNAAKGVAAE